jgi:hypothetical protein
MFVIPDLNELCLYIVILRLVNGKVSQKSFPPHLLGSLHCLKEFLSHKFRCPNSPAKIFINLELEIINHYVKGIKNLLMCRNGVKRTLTILL